MSSPRSFENDVRQSLQRIETETGNIHTYIEERVEQERIKAEQRLQAERDKSDKKYAPIILWTGFLGLMGIFAAVIAPRIISLVWPG